MLRLFELGVSYVQSVISDFSIFSGGTSRILLTYLRYPPAEPGFLTHGRQARAV